MFERRARFAEPSNRHFRWPDLLWESVQPPLKGRLWIVLFATTRPTPWFTRAMLWWGNERAIDINGGTYFKWLERESQSRCTWNIILSSHVVFSTFFEWILTFMLFALSTFQSVLKVLCQTHLSVVSFIGTSSRKLTGGFHSYRIKHLKHRHHAVVQSYIAPYKAPVDCKCILQAPPCINDDELNTRCMFLLSPQASLASAQLSSLASSWAEAELHARSN